MVSTLDRFQSIDPALLDIGPDDNVIDLGCGTGRHVLELSKIPSNIIGADISRDDIRAGRYLLEIMRRRGEVNARVHWLQTAGERLPFKDGAFDRVICTETLEHVDDDTVLARELARVLKPGGILAVSVPDEYSEKIFWVLSTNYRTHAGGHVRIYRRREIVNLMRHAGLHPYAVRYRHALETAYWLSHIAFWSDWGKQGPITSAFRKLLDSQRARTSKIVTMLDDIGNRALPKSIVVYSRKPLHAIDGTHGTNGHSAPTALPADERTTVEVRAIPAPFAVDPGVPEVAEPEGPAVPAAPFSLRDELRIALRMDGERQKARLIEIIRSCRFNFLREIQSLDGEQAAMPWTEDGRSLKEVLGHIIGWERWTVAALREIADGSLEPGIMSLAGYPIGIARYASIDVFNAVRMAEARERPWSELLDESASVFEELVSAAEAVSANELHDTSEFYWPVLGGTLPCGLYLLMVAAHHYQEEHLPEVVRVHSSQFTVDRSPESRDRAGL
jgi:ubiquinone/menaquinone biosynthesis C-methylase UbiE